MRPLSESTAPALPALTAGHGGGATPSEALRLRDFNAAFGWMTRVALTRQMTTTRWSTCTARST